jgi:hypothetical protein
MTLTITINMDNAAFDPEPGPEVARILRELVDRADLIANHADSVVLRDVNGNRCGRVSVESSSTALWRADR